MYLPGYYGDPIEEYWHLLNHVTIWDVAVERIVQIEGSDALAFTNMLTCRDLTTCAVGQGKYAPIIAPDGGIVNDPVLLRIAASSPASSQYPPHPGHSSTVTRRFTL